MTVRHRIGVFTLMVTLAAPAIAQPVPLEERTGGGIGGSRGNRQRQRRIYTPGQSDHRPGKVVLHDIVANPTHQRFVDHRRYVAPVFDVARTISEFAIGENGDRAKCFFKLRQSKNNFPTFVDRQ